MTRNILIVEDQAILALDLEALLSAAGYKVVGIAATTSQALRIARSERVDAATMDIELALGDNGVDTSIALRALGVRSLFVSGSLDDNVRALADRAEPLGFLSKPIDQEALTNALHVFFEHGA
ncbi:response regulator [Cereibacter sp. SYSU M97828]|nr:response regulator [Cereibacter flavus]